MPPSTAARSSSPSARHASMDALVTAIEAVLAGPEIDGRIADRYVLKERIGSGGSSIVFRAYDERTGRELAIKLLSEASAGDRGERSRAAGRISRSQNARKPSWSGPTWWT